MMKRLLPTVIFAALAIGLAVVFYVKSLHLPKAAYQLPRILVVVVTLLSVAMVGEAVYAVKKKQESVPKRPAPDAPEKGTEAIKVRRIFVFVFLIVAYIAAIQPLGYFLVTPFYILATYLYLKATRIANIVAISIGYTLFVYLLFIRFLHLPVPMGIFG